MLQTEKIGLIADLHFGEHNFSENFLKIQLEGLQYIADEFRVRGVRTIYQLGDIFHNRRIFEFNVINILKNEIPKIFDGFEVYSLTGNHDMYYKNSREIVSTDIFKDALNINQINSTTIKSHGNVKFALVPWLLDGEELPSPSECDVVLGHFEISGTQFSLNGFDNTSYITKQDILSKYKKVYSGHYHFNQIYQKETMNYKGIYLGTPYQINWKEFCSVPGALVLTIEDNKISEEFIENNISPRYTKVFIYDDYVEVNYRNFNEKVKLKDFFVAHPYCNILKVYIETELESSFLFENIGYIENFTKNYEVIHSAELNKVINENTTKDENIYLSSHELIESFFTNNESELLDVIKELLED